MFDEGPNKHLGRRGPTHSAKEVDSSPNIGEGKPPKRGISGYSSHEVCLHPVFCCGVYVFYLYCIVFFFFHVLLVVGVS